MFECTYVLSLATAIVCLLRLTSSPKWSLCVYLKCYEKSGALMNMEIMSCAFIKKSNAIRMKQV